MEFLFFKSKSLPKSQSKQKSNSRSESKSRTKVFMTIFSFSLLVDNYSCLQNQPKNEGKKRRKRKTRAHRIPSSNIDLLAAGSPTLLPPCCHRPTKHLCTLAFHKILDTHFLASSLSFTSFRQSIPRDVSGNTSQ